MRSAASSLASTKPPRTHAPRRSRRAACGGAATPAVVACRVVHACQPSRVRTVREAHSPDSSGLRRTARRATSAPGLVDTAHGSACHLSLHSASPPRNRSHSGCGRLALQAMAAAAAARAASRGEVPAQDGGVARSRLREFQRRAPLRTHAVFARARALKRSNMRARARTPTGPMGTHTRSAPVR